MYLAAFYVALDVDPEVTSFDRQRLLRSLREKLKQKFQHRIVAGIDADEMAISISFFDESFERSKARIESIQESIEAAGEARIRFCQEQIYMWFDGQFVETESGNQKFYQSMNAKEKTIVYADAEEEDMVPIPSRFSRKSFRIPTRK